MVAAVVLASCIPAQACEPILPFIKVVGGPATLLNSGLLLLAAIAIKSILFSLFQKRLSFLHAAFLMLAGNIFTTFIGVLAAAMIGSGPILFLGFFIVWALCVIPARRFLVGIKRPWLKKFSPLGFAGVMASALVASCILFGLSTIFADSKHLLIYWIWKLIAVYLALIASIFLTAFWEEWVIWKLSRCPTDYTGYVKPVLRANLAVLLCVMIFAAAKALPGRLKSPNHLISLERFHEDFEHKPVNASLKRMD